MNLYSSTSNTSDETLTREKFIDLMNKARGLMDSAPPDGLQGFAKQHGFDLDRGDMMVIPKGFAEAHDIYPRKGVHISDRVDCSVVLMRGVNQGFCEVKWD